MAKKIPVFGPSDLSPTAFTDLEKTRPGVKPVRVLQRKRPPDLFKSVAN